MNSGFQPRQILVGERFCKVGIPLHALRNRWIFSIEVTGLLENCLRRLIGGCRCSLLICFSFAGDLCHSYSFILRSHTPESFLLVFFCNALLISRREQARGRSGYIFSIYFDGGARRSAVATGRLKYLLRYAEILQWDLRRFLVDRLKEKKQKQFQNFVDVLWSLTKSYNDQKNQPDLK